MQRAQRPRTIFLDSGVIIDGCYSEWSASKGVLILAAQCRQHYQIVLAEAVDTEVQRALQLKAQQITAQGLHGGKLLSAYSTWLKSVQLLRYPLPEPDQIAQHLASVLPALRHSNDLPAAVTAIQIRPDWVLSTNDRHWGRALAQITQLRVAHPRDFLTFLSAFRS